MEPNATRSYATKTDEELAALSEWLGQHLDDLQRQQAAIEAELRIRAENQSRGPTMVDPLGDLPPQIRLQYHNPETVFAHEGLTGDPYADESRAYGLRIGLAMCVAGAFFVVLLVVVGSMH